MMGMKPSAAELAEMRATLGLLGVGMSDADLCALDELPLDEQQRLLTERATRPATAEAHGKRWSLLQRVGDGQNGGDICLAVEWGVKAPTPVMAIEVRRPKESS